MGKLQKVLKTIVSLSWERKCRHSLTSLGILEDNVLVFPAALYSKILLQKASH